MRGVGEALPCSGGQPVSRGAHTGHQDGPRDLDPILVPTLVRLVTWCPIRDTKALSSELPPPSSAAPAPTGWHLRSKGGSSSSAIRGATAPCGCRLREAVLSSLFTPVKNCRTARQSLTLNSLRITPVVSVSSLEPDQYSTGPKTVWNAAQDKLPLSLSCSKPEH